MWWTIPVIILLGMSRCSGITVIHMTLFILTAVCLYFGPLISQSCSSLTMVYFSSYTVIHIFLSIVEVYYPSHLPLNYYILWSTINSILIRLSFSLSLSLFSAQYLPLNWQLSHDPRQDRATVNTTWWSSLKSVS